MPRHMPADRRPIGLADRVAVMSGGTINYVSPISETDRSTIGKHMAGH